VVEYRTFHCRPAAAGIWSGALPAVSFRACSRLGVWKSEGTSSYPIARLWLAPGPVLMPVMLGRPETCTGVRSVLPQVHTVQVTMSRAFRRLEMSLSHADRLDPSGGPLAGAETATSWL
jgi:hypothetical protein